MNIVDTGSKFILRIDNALDDKICDEIRSFAENSPTFLNCVGNMPESKILSFGSEIYTFNNKISRTISAYKFMLSQIIYKYFDKIVYPDSTEMMYFFPGANLGWHPDSHPFDVDSTPPIPNTQYHRTISTVFYINDDYGGGETVIRTEPWTDDFIRKVKQTNPKNLNEAAYNLGHEISIDSEYVSKPKKGSVIIFDSRCYHKANPNWGNRITLPTWFGEDPRVCEFFKN